MTELGLAALIAAVSFAVLALTGVVVAVRLSGLFGAATAMIREAGEGHDTVLARVNAAVERANAQLDRTEGVTAGMDKLGEGVQELATQVNALSEFGKTMAGALVTGPAGKAAAVAYGIRHAVGQHSDRRRPAVAGQVVERAQIAGGAGSKSGAPGKSSARSRNGVPGKRGKSGALR
jgi:hypothetical protein